MVLIDFFEKSMVLVDFLKKAWTVVHGFDRIFEKSMYYSSLFRSIF